MTTEDHEVEPKVNALKTFVPIGSLLALLTLTFGGAAFATTLRSSVDVAISELGELKTGIRDLGKAVQTQATTVTLLQQQQIHLTRSDEVHRDELRQIRERIHQVELQLRDKK